jgi:hypothetical protein
MLGDMHDAARRPRSRPIRLWAITGAFLVMAVMLIAASTPRRVGDGVEYWAMAEQLRTFRRPSAAHGDLLRLEREARRIDNGFDESPLRFPELVAADGRQDFPHFWLYPLVNVPALWLTSALRLHPAWAFTLTNLALFAIAFVVVSRYTSIEWSALLLAGPLLWWIDKAHGDVFTVSLIAMTCACWPRAPAWAMVWLAGAAAQNPVLMPVWVLVAAIAFVRVLRSEPGAARVRLAIGIVMGAAILAVPLAYYQARLHVWSPLMGYTHPTTPSMRTIVSLLIDPNVGLVPNAPFLMAALILAVMVALGTRRPALEAIDPTSPPRTKSHIEMWQAVAIAIGACVILLAGYAQSTNFNHGATPGLNRWTLWLTPWPLLIVAASQAASGSESASRATAADMARHLFVLLAALNTVWALVYFRPAFAEVYRYPTRTAAWLWTHAPEWYAPAPEIFAERVSHREPAVLPVAWDGCRTILLIGGHWPAPCTPTADTPPACLGSTRLCYAIPSDDDGDRTTFIPLGEAAFGLTISPRRWPANAAFAQSLRTQLARDKALRADEGASAVLRAADRIAWTSAWRSDSTLAIYLESASPDASVRVRVDRDHDGELIDLDTNTVLAHVSVPRSTAQPSSIEITGSTNGVRHGLIWLQKRANGDATQAPMP